MTKIKRGSRLAKLTRLGKTLDTYTTIPELCSFIHETDAKADAAPAFSDALDEQASAARHVLACRPATTWADLRLKAQALRGAVILDGNVLDDSDEIQFFFAVFCQQVADDASNTEKLLVLADYADAVFGGNPHKFEMAEHGGIVGPAFVSLVADIRRIAGGGGGMQLAA